MLEIRWSILVVIVYHKSPQNLFWCCHTQNERITVASLYNWLGQLNESTSLEKTLFAHVTLRQFLHSDRPTSLVSWSSETNKVRTFYSLIIVHRHEYRFQMWLASNPCSSSCTHISVNNLCTDCTKQCLTYLQELFIIDFFSSHIDLLSSLNQREFWKCVNDLTVIHAFETCNTVESID